MFWVSSLLNLTLNNLTKIRDFDTCVRILKYTDTLLLPDDARWISSEILYIYIVLSLKIKSINVKLAVILFLLISTKHCGNFTLNGL